MPEVSLCRGLPDARASWDRAHALGEQLDGVFRRARRPQNVVVKVHRNRRTLIRWRVLPDAFELRVHHAFLPHPDDVIAVVLHKDDAAWERLKALPRGALAPELQRAGAVHHLDELLVTEMARVPWRDAPPVDLTLGWGRWPTRPPRRTLRLGSCEQGPPPLVRVHPVLDHADVPDWFVGFIVFHELLHLRFPPFVEGGRRRVHPRSFRAAEARHPDHRRATEWEHRHVGELLARARLRVRTSRRG